MKKTSNTFYGTAALAIEINASGCQEWLDNGGDDLWTKITGDGYPAVCGVTFLPGCGFDRLAEAKKIKGWETALIVERIHLGSFDQAILNLQASGASGNEYHELYSQFDGVPKATHRVLRSVSRAAEKGTDTPLFDWNGFDSDVLTALEAAGITRIEIDENSVRVDDLATLHAAGWTFAGKADREEVVLGRTEKCGGAVFEKN